MNRIELSTSSGWKKFIQNIRVFGHWLSDPSKDIQELAQRRKAQLLSMFLVCLFLLFLGVNLVYSLTIPGYGLPVTDLIGYGILALTYLISRSRYTGGAVLLLLVMFPINVFGNVLQGTTTNLVATLSFLIPSYILASIFLNPWGTAIYGYGVNALILALPLLMRATPTEFQLILGPFSVGMIVVTLCIIWIIHRDLIERDHHAKLKEAYDNTLEGWSLALEIRDKATEGHSRRVTELTMRLGRALGLRGEQLESLYRGALLHDIGKMAIPDSILMKNASLTEEEWQVMRTHPRMAYNMLAMIPFLHPALDIPAYHHEWWDGGGYPTGLSGEQIPLAARIFAIVDVWDALLSDRPYRKAWSRDQVVEYVKTQSGRQFDPKIVESFFSILP